MHNPSYMKASEVEVYAVRHVLDQTMTFDRSGLRVKVKDIVSRAVEMEAGSPVQNTLLDSVLREFYYSCSKYEFIYLIRELTLMNVMISYKNVPFFRTVVSSLSDVVRDSRRIARITVVKH